MVDVWQRVVDAGRFCIKVLLVARVKLFGVVARYPAHGSRDSVMRR